VKKPDGLGEYLLLTDTLLGPLPNGRRDLDASRLGMVHPYLSLLWHCGLPVFRAAEQGTGGAKGTRDGCLPPSPWTRRLNPSKLGFVAGHWKQFGDNQ